MKSQKAFLSFSLFALALLSPQFSQALAPSQENATISTDETATNQETDVSSVPGPICILDATVRTVQKNSLNPDYYDVNLKINGISAAEANATSLCDESYAAQIEKSGQVIETSDYLKQAMQEGDSIKAEVESANDGTLTGYFLSNILIANQSDKIQSQTGQEESAVAAANNQPANNKNDSFQKLIGAFSLLTILILAGMIYSARDKTKKIQ